MFNIPLDDFSKSTTSTPFRWIDNDTKRDMLLNAGVMGISMTESGALKPEVGWVVSQAEPQAS